ADHFLRQSACRGMTPLLRARTYPGGAGVNGSLFTCGRGGTGRRATLRSLWAKARGSSSLLDRTKHHISRCNLKIKFGARRTSAILFEAQELDFRHIKGNGQTLADRQRIPLLTHVSQSSRA